MAGLQNPDVLDSAEVLSLFLLWLASPKPWSAKKLNLTVYHSSVAATRRDYFCLCKPLKVIKSMHMGTVRHKI